MFVHWEKQFSVGNELIDAEHRMMMLLCRKLDFAIKNDVSERNLMSIIQELKAFSQFHFISEENLMHEVGYPGLFQHGAIHSQLLKTLDEMTMGIVKHKTSEFSMLDFFSQLAAEPHPACRRGARGLCQVRINETDWGEILQTFSNLPRLNSPPACEPHASEQLPIRIYMHSQTLWLGQ